MIGPADLRHKGVVAASKLIFLTAVLMLLRSCAPGETPDLSHTTNLQLIGAKIGVTFPGSAKLTYYHQGGFQDEYLVVKAVFPKSETEQFVKSGRLPKIKWSTTSRATDGTVVRHAEWHPERSRRFRSGQMDYDKPRGGRAGIRVLIDEDDAETDTVYLVWFET